MHFFILKSPPPSVHIIQTHTVAIGSRAQELRVALSHRCYVTNWRRWRRAISLSLSLSLFLGPTRLVADPFTFSIRSRTIFSHDPSGPLFGSVRFRRIGDAPHGRKIGAKSDFLTEQTIPAATMSAISVEAKLVWPRFCYSSEFNLATS
jgi:hypothetical protein